MKPAIRERTTAAQLLLCRAETPSRLFPDRSLTRFGKSSIPRGSPGLIRQTANKMREYAGHGLALSCLVSQGLDLYATSLRPPRGRELQKLNSTLGLLRLVL